MIFRILKMYGLTRVSLGLALAHALIFLAICAAEPVLPPPSTKPEPCPPDAVCFDRWNFWGIYLAGRDFHHTLSFKLLVLADAPCLLAGSVMTLPVNFFHVSRVTGTYIDAAVLFCFGTLQWWLVGMYVSHWRTRGAA